MADAMDTPERRLAAMGLVLPHPAPPTSLYRPWRRDGGVIWLAGQVCELDGRISCSGKLGREVSLDDGRAAARLCAMQLLGVLRAALEGDLNRVRACLRLNGYVNCAPDFPDVPRVIDGASELVIEILGDARGVHARTAVGVAQLPRGAAVEVEGVFAVD